jgi:hypothetical protein
MVDRCSCAADVTRIRKRHSWSVQDAAASNMLQCKLNSEDGAHELRAEPCEGSNTFAAPELNPVKVRARGR